MRLHQVAIICAAIALCNIRKLRLLSKIFACYCLLVQAGFPRLESERLKFIGIYFAIVQEIRGKTSVRCYRKSPGEDCLG
jgi:hypothetical protein